jgi:transmembrane sensor
MSEIDRDLLNRYLSGDVSPEESDRVEAWLAEDPDRWGELARLRDMAQDSALGGRAIEQAREEVWARLRGDLSGEVELGPIEGGQRSRPPAREFALSAPRRWISGGQLAAALFIAATAGAALAAWHRTQQAAPAPMRVATTAPGQRATFRLPDGTRVMMGVASTLRYPAESGRSAREVSVEGEAYFEVVHDERRPFVVRAGDLVAKDIGTAFTARAYPEDAGARVVVREGRVDVRPVRGGALATTVAPGQQANLALDGTVKLAAADTAAVFAWMTGRLVLKGVRLREALPDLARWFNLDFRLADSGLGDIPLTVSLASRPSPSTLSSLAAALGLEQTQHDRTVTLRAARPPR